jgi:hypothetical protein
MEPLKLLLVSFPEEWCNSLVQSLTNAGYYFEIHEVPTKKKALFACYQSKYDILITNNHLPDGSSKDLVHVLGSTMPCLVISNNSTPSLSSFQSDQQVTERSYLSLMQPRAWITALKQVLVKWEKNVAGKIAQGCQNRRQLYDKVAARCAAELYLLSENRIENSLRVILDILEVSRIYVRAMSRQKALPSKILHEISAPGQQYIPSPNSAVYEVPIRQSNEQISFLGVVDSNNQRVWDKAETDLLKTVASLLRENQEGIRHKINMYSELGMTA